MRCLPDSLDIVTLTNADNFSKFDAEDMDVMREKGTKVLYQVDYAARAEEFADMQALDAYLDRVVAAVAANGMDGYSFTTDPLATDATARIVEKFAAAKSEGQLLVFEGNPLSLAAADRPKVDFIALDSFSEPQTTTIVKDEVDLLVSTPEQAFLECLLLAPQQYSYMDLFYMMEQLTTLRPEMLQRLLETTKSLKVKRMFLYMAEKSGHYWLDALDTSKIELGTSKLQLAKNGVYISKYKITVPKELNEYE